MSERDRVRLSQVVEDKSAKQTTTETATPQVDAGSVQSPAQSILSLQRTHGNAAVQRMLAVDQETYTNGGPIGSNISSMINSKRGSGHGLDSSVQAKAEAAYGQDFSDVSVHTDGESQQLNEALGAEAFTTGKDVFLSQKSINNPETQLHELSHVIQQEGSTPNGDLTLGPANDAYESEADSMAATAMSGGETATAQAKRDGDLQRESVPEDELMTKRDASIQREAMEEDELMTKRDASVQREAVEEEEMVQEMRDSDVQRQSEEEEMMG